ncbi:MAG: hypothetical protein LBK96_00775 [Prevotellaceae bacterium]|jgi:hypothetical protein|nr:hypothetical protein [Prevotellaceae bacterium]
MFKFQFTIALSVMFLWTPHVRAQNDSAATKIQAPEISGLLKTRWEYCFEDNTGRFDIRNARVKLGGKLSRHVAYGLQMDYSTHGKLSQYQNMYANRSFVAKFVNPDSRDLGMQLDYKIPRIPLTAHAGVYNGAGINNPQWQKSPFVLSRLVYGTMEGFRAGLKYYGGKTPAGDRIANYGFDLRYAGDRYAVETEYVVKDSVNTGAYLSAAYLQGSYRFPVNGKMAKYITPTLRGDAMGYDFFDRGFDVSRLTLGLNMGLGTKQMDTEIRFNYEYFVRKNESGIRDDPYYAAYFERTDKGMFDKFTVEFLIKF